MLGDVPVERRDSAPPGVKMNTTDNGRSDSGFGKKAGLWKERNDLTDGEVETVFHIEGDKVDVIGSPPAKTKREQTINAYLLRSPV